MIFKLHRYIKGKLRTRKAKNALRHVLLVKDTGFNNLPDANWLESLRDPTSYYIRAVRYFHQALPEDLRKHRAYFRQHRRGFGEDAFHTLWWMLFEKFRPAAFLEIGVYRGQTLSLASLLHRRLNIPGKVVGISPFLPAGDSVTSYRDDVNYLDDTLKNFAHFSLPEPELVRAYSTDEVAVSRIAADPWDLIYIDGNHDYEVARKDWDICASAVRPGGLIALDDSGLTTSYQPPAFATGGHPGPSKLAAEIDRVRFEEILQVGHIRIFQKREEGNVP